MTTWASTAGSIAGTMTAGLLGGSERLSELGITKLAKSAANKTGEFLVYAADNWQQTNFAWDKLGESLTNGFDDMGGLTLNVVNFGSIIDIFDGEGTSEVAKKLGDVGLLEININSKGDVSRQIGMNGIDAGGFAGDFVSNVTWEDFKNAGSSAWNGLKTGWGMIAGAFLSDTQGTVEAILDAGGSIEKLASALGLPAGVEVGTVLNELKKRYKNSKQVQEYIQKFYPPKETKIPEDAIERIFLADTSSDPSEKDGGTSFDMSQYGFRNGKWISEPGVQPELGFTVSWPSAGSLFGGNPNGSVSYNDDWITAIASVTVNNYTSIEIEGSASLSVEKLGPLSFYSTAFVNVSAKYNSPNTFEAKGDISVPLNYKASATGGFFLNNTGFSANFGASFSLANGWTSNTSITAVNDDKNPPNLNLHVDFNYSF
jgi:hypothetical protein